MGTTTCFGLLFIMFCEPSGPKTPPPPDTFCQQYKPVYVSPADTRKTKEQVDIANRRWKAVCRDAPRAK